MTKPAEVMLLVGATAEPNTCGSCQSFRRRVDSGEWYSTNGTCNFKFPTKVAEMANIREVDPRRRDQEYTGNEDMIQDTDRCDLYRSTGLTYIVQRRVSP